MHDGYLLLNLSNQFELMIRKFLASCTLYLVPCLLFSQQFGGNPPSIKWKQINTDTARIIFPQGMDSTAERVSDIIHWLAKNNPAQLGHQLYKVILFYRHKQPLPMVTYHWLLFGVNIF